MQRSKAYRGVSHADEVGRLLKSHRTPPRVRSVDPATIPPEGLNMVAANLWRHVGNNAYQIANGACEAYDLIKAGSSWDNASDYLKGKPPAGMYWTQAEGLLK